MTIAVAVAVTMTAGPVNELGLLCYQIAVPAIAPIAITVTNAIAVTTALAAAVCVAVGARVTIWTRGAGLRGAGPH
jgi:hypothetical protein